MKFLIIFIYLITTGFGHAIDKPNIKNLVLIKTPKTYEEVIFKDKNQKDVNLADYKGKLLVLNFWATWCPPCLEEIPLFVQLQDEYKDRNVTFIGIAVDDAHRVREFVRDNEINYPVLIGSGDALRISEILGNKRSVLPFTVCLNPSGDLIDMHSGVVPESKVRKFVDKIR